MCNCSTFKSPLSLGMWWSPSSLVLSVPVQKTAFSLPAGTQEKYPVPHIYSSAYNMLILTTSSLTLRRFRWHTLLYNLLFYPPCVPWLILKECSVFDRESFIFWSIYIIISLINSRKKKYCQYFAVVQGHQNPQWQLTVKNPNMWHSFRRACIVI